MDQTFDTRGMIIKELGRPFSTLKRPAPLAFTVQKGKLFIPGIKLRYRMVLCTSNVKICFVYKNLGTIQLIGTVWFFSAVRFFLLILGREYFLGRNRDKLILVVTRTVCNCSFWFAADELRASLTSTCFHILSLFKSIHSYLVQILRFVFGARAQTGVTFRNGLIIRHGSIVYALQDLAQIVTKAK